MFKDMSDTVGFCWDCLKREAEHIFRVVGGNVHHLGSRRDMAELDQLAMELLDIVDICDGEIVVGLSD